MIFFRKPPISQIDSFAVSNIGKQRQNNEDNFAINGKYMDEITVAQCADGQNVCVSGGVLSAEKIPILAICDGMGGEALGEVASLTGATQFAKLYGKSTNNIDKLIDSTIVKANSMILRKAEQNGRFRIGTTLALAYICKSVLQVVNVGDSRVYLLHNGKLRQISYDHTELQYYISAKIVSKEEARTHPRRHGLTQHLGMNGNELKPYRSKGINLAAGDRLLLCSDGVTEMIDDNELAEILGASLSSEEASNAIVAKALENGGVDNTTAVVAFIS